MRISSSNVRPKRRALRRASAGAIAMSPRYDFSSAGNERTSVGLLLRRYPRFHRAIWAFVTRHTVSELAGRCNALCARTRNLSSCFNETRTRRWRFKIISGSATCPFPTGPAPNPSRWPGAPSTAALSFPWPPPVPRDAAPRRMARPAPFRVWLRMALPPAQPALPQPSLRVLLPPVFPCASSFLFLLFSSALP